jgi:hypothetical protein
MDEQKVKELIEEYGEGIDNFEIKSIDNEKHHIEVEAQYEFPFVVPMMNPFSLEKMLIVFDKDDQGEIMVTQISLRSKDDLEEAKQRCFPPKINNDKDKKSKMERADVYKLIDGERDYQDWRWTEEIRKDRVPDEEKRPAEWLNYIKYHLEQGEISNYMLSKEQTMSEIRKIAALAVRAIEIHGCPEREMPAIK